MADFDWLSLGNFQPMDDTMTLSPRIEEEPVDNQHPNDQLQEEHFSLSAMMMLMSLSRANQKLFY